MTAKYTPTPWRMEGEESKSITGILGPNNESVMAYLIDEDMPTSVAQKDLQRARNDFRRAVACVNFCAGMNPEAVPDLVAACEAVDDDRELTLHELQELQRAALAKARKATT